MVEFARKYFSVILVVSCGIGFVVPDPGKVSNFLILFLLFLIIFASFFQLDMNRAVILKEAGNTIKFTLIRFVIIPVIFYFIIFPFSEFYAYSVFFLALQPAAVASPAYTNLFKSNVNLAILILVLSSFLVILTIPVLGTLLTGPATEISPRVLLRTLFLTIILPFVLHLPLRRFNFLKGQIKKNLSLLFILIVARNKEILISYSNRLPWFFLYGTIFYLMAYLAGWIIFIKNPREDKIPGSVTSGMNNIGLGVALATLYLGPEISVFYITAEFAWVGILIPVRMYFRKMVEENK